MLVTYGRGGGGRTGPDELSVADDGAFTLWRSTHAGPIGQFAGTVEPDTLTALRAAVDGAKAEGAPDPGTRMPGGSIERIAIGDFAAVLPNEDPGGPWSALVGQLRTLLDELTAQPVAAIALEVGDGKASLHHLGAKPLDVRLSGLVVHVIRFGPGYARLDEWRSTPDGADDDVRADPGWTFDLPFDHGLQVTDEQSLQVVVSMEAYRGDAAYPVQIVQPPHL